MISIVRLSGQTCRVGISLTKELTLNNRSVTAVQMCGHDRGRHWKLTPGGTLLCSHLSLFGELEWWCIGSGMWRSSAAWPGGRTFTHTLWCVWTPDNVRSLCFDIWLHPSQRDAFIATNLLVLWRWCQLWFLAFTVHLKYHRINKWN